MAIPAPPAIAPAAHKTPGHEGNAAPNKTHDVEKSSKHSDMIRAQGFSMSGERRLANTTPTRRTTIIDKSNTSRVAGSRPCPSKYDPTNASSIHARYAAKPMNASGSFGSLEARSPPLSMCSSATVQQPHHQYAPVRPIEHNYIPPTLATPTNVAPFSETEPNDQAKHQVTQVVEKGGREIPPQKRSWRMVFRNRPRHDSSYSAPPFPSPTSAGAPSSRIAKKGRFTRKV